MLLYEGWLLTLGVGLGVLAFARVFTWPQIRGSSSLRLFLCLVLSFCFAPSLFTFGGGDHFGGVAVWPASLMLALAFSEGNKDILFIGIPLLSILITFSVVTGLWSRVLRKRSAAQRNP
jgi:hypothetical protein